MRWKRSYAIAILWAFSAVGWAQEQPVWYFNQAPPGETPAVFAPEIISKADRFEQFLSYSPTGLELFLGLTNSDWSEFSIHILRYRDGRWHESGAESFPNAMASALTTAWSFDESKVFFSSMHSDSVSSDVWATQRSPRGWSTPEKLAAPVSSDAHEFEVAITQSGTLYFSSAREGGYGDLDIYYSRPVDGTYPAAQNLGPTVNSSSGDDLPYVAPDESYLIFASDKPGGLGFRDLYISFRCDGEWSEPESLGAPINSVYWDIYPSVSPDGKYLFFARRTSWQATEDSDIYWVSTDFIDRLRAAAHDKCDRSE